MQFPADQLTPKGGSIYAHVFENQETGLQRNLFWSITVDFESIRYGEELFDCSMTSEWIRWPIMRWRDLHGRHVEVDYGEDGVESSFYMCAHDIGRHTRLSLTYERENIFRTHMTMEVDFTGYYGGDELPSMWVHAEVEIAYEGLLVIPDNLAPKPVGPAQVKKVAGQFADLSTYREPVPHNEGYILRPIW